MFVGQAKKDETGLSQKEQKQIIDEFKRLLKIEGSGKYEEIVEKISN